MISETDGFTVPIVLSWMGNLSQERVVAKHAARQGLVKNHLTRQYQEISDGLSLSLLAPRVPSPYNPKFR